MANLIGSDANQISTNGMLGTAAFVDEATLAKVAATQAALDAKANKAATVLVPSASATPATNGDLMIEATSNTTLTFKLKGSDGTVRSGTLTLS